MPKHAAPSRGPPVASVDLDVSRTLNLGEFADADTLSLSEARIVLLKTLDSRFVRGETRPEDLPEVTNKTRDYLEIFAVFKDLSAAQQVETLINSLGTGLEKFEKSQLKSLCPTCADEAKALIPSLEKKCEDGTVNEDELEGMCRELQKLKRKAEL